MIRSSVRSAGLAILLMMNGCGDLMSRGGDTKNSELRVAEVALEGGAGQIALQISDGVLQDAPNNVHALEIKGDALSLLGFSDEAAAVFKALLDKDPDSIRANIGMGRAKLGKEPAAAEAFFLAVLKRDPKDQTALNNLGIARDLQGRHADAQLAYRQVLAINPDLTSAKVNLALSMAMSGQGPAAVELLKTEANQPGAPDKVKHDYAVVLAMTGRRAEAETVLNGNLPPDEVRRVLDNVTGTKTAPARAVAVRRDDEVPADVVQVPEPPAAPTRIVRSAPPVAVAALPVQPPMVVHPQPDSDTPPVVQPVSPVAAAMTYQRPLSLPIRGDESLAPPAPAPEDATVVAMPPVRQVQKVVPLPVRVASVDLGALPAAPAPSQFRAVPAAIRVDPPTPAPTARRASLHVHDDATEPTQSRIVAATEGSPAVQFAATASEESAHAFWRDLVRRFPDVLARREPTVIRFERGGTIFWRVRTEGFGNLSEAQALCARIRSSGQNCFVPPRS